MYHHPFTEKERSHCRQFKVFAGELAIPLLQFAAGFGILSIQTD